MEAAYEELRRQAAAKRDKIIQNARQEYRIAVRRIRALHKMVTGDTHPMIRPPRRPEDQSLEDILIAVLPTDKPFTMTEACELVYADPIACKYKENSIRSGIATLGRRGLLHKVGRRRGSVLWASTKSDKQVEPFGAMTVCEIADTLILEHGPMRFMEIVARMQQRGYRPDLAPGTIYENLRRAMQRSSGRFVKDQAGRWDCSEATT